MPTLYTVLFYWMKDVPLMKCSCLIDDDDHLAIDWVGQVVVKIHPFA